MKKILCVCAIILMLAMSGCAGLTGKQVTDLTLMGAQTIYAAASGYYKSSKTAFAPEDQELFERYLAGFKLAVETGGSVAPFIERWAEFQQGR